MNFIDTIVQNKTECLFISPHFDDAVLSCGDVLTTLAGKTKISIINVFTHAHQGPYTLSARKFLTDSGKQTDAQVLFEERAREDKLVLKRLQVTPINLGLVDGLFRKKENYGLVEKLFPELHHVYPTYRWHLTTKISKHDSSVVKLPELLRPYAKINTLVFAPFGIGNHVDHVLVRQACERTFNRLVLYSDFPYNKRMEFFGEAPVDMKRVDIAANMTHKLALVKLYKTQFSGLFPGDVFPKHNEVYFIPKTL